MESSKAWYDRIESVYFGYQQENLVLNNLNLVLKNKTAYLVQGESGSGKTSLFKLLLGFYSPVSGEVIMEEPSKIVAYVPQNPFLYAGTIKENIMHGKQDAEESEYRHAIKRAYVDEIIEKLPEGDMTVLEGSGKNISRGSDRG